MLELRRAHAPGCTGVALDEVMRTIHLARATRVLGGWGAVLVIAASAVACAPKGFGNDADGDSDRTPGADQGAHAATRSEQNAGATVQGVATFTAADVARIVLVLEQTSIAQARLAEERATTM